CARQAPPYYGSTYYSPFDDW
nr:immunoglobulin heavy chain junction region [Macaca mulatta]MOX37760.1 immunoglobulin heavy chain junction region [Macaca mulatta]MOX37770.1 immunoglobulin heavy chain junction region [Macaca mulatta]MOX37851.1 immunoglobulin heavy chain junction region [Macaca mulatta]MOX37900.1 immunoglobulin heavy chain junction region [Macaca mulatta]